MQKGGQEQSSKTCAVSRQILRIQARLEESKLLQDFDEQPHDHQNCDHLKAVQSQHSGPFSSHGMSLGTNYPNSLRCKAETTGGGCFTSSQLSRWQIGLWMGPELEASYRALLLALTTPNRTTPIFRFSRHPAWCPYKWFVTPLGDSRSRSFWQLKVTSCPKVVDTVCSEGAGEERTGACQGRRSTRGVRFRV
ncbi:hypothetical protein AAFF_G00138270 [Aldrovandia affinis]|uniref:Uncharacterized protein n=1 Tax=Aldrovandia affinis TaxID=143900 RepID=A0AAD7TC76_9TELE|nr:hypothetical protein AAFF_G00138270 [Aldrovandia affinis]